MPKSIRSYQRDIRKLKLLIREIQWVMPAYNGALSCSGCGQMMHQGCASDCPAAKVTGRRGTRE